MIRILIMYCMRKTWLNMLKIACGNPSIFLIKKSNQSIGHVIKLLAFSRRSTWIAVTITDHLPLLFSAALVTLFLLQNQFDFFMIFINIKILTVINLSILSKAIWNLMYFSIMRFNLNETFFYFLFFLYKIDNSNRNFTES